MAKTVCGPSGEAYDPQSGNWVPTGITTYKNTRARRKSEQAELIGWTKGPTTRGQKIARALWG